MKTKKVVFLFMLIFVAVHLEQKGIKVIEFLQLFLSPMATYLLLPKAVYMVQVILATLIL